ncbi:MAG: glycosyltransferase family 2 protein [Planctomycetaceae bacterium]|nr:glycosyltransferase family 2 protein [Planctomycetaceae bacterium]
MPTLGVIAIGRNEGQRLRRCLDSVMGHGLVVVYVDSGSADGSVELARSLGAEVVELDISRPFTAARARNEGFERLCQIDPEVRFVQFIDGDCELAEGWLERARGILEENLEVGVVCGRRRERFPQLTVYNRLADLEWNTPIGEASACGGDALMRVEAVRRVGGYNAAIIAAEDDELCLRIRRAGWKVLRIDCEMTLHDMAMDRFWQWWKRSTRTGHAYAEGSAMHGRAAERHFVRQTRSTIFWGIVLPLLTVGLAWPTRGLSLALLGGYPLLYHRTTCYYAVQRGWPPADARLYAFWIVLAKFPQAVGLLRYGLGRLAGKPSPVIEHRSTLPARDTAAG